MPRPPPPLSGKEVKELICIAGGHHRPRKNLESDPDQRGISYTLARQAILGLEPKHDMLRVSEAHAENNCTSPCLPT